MHVGLDLLFLDPGRSGGRETYARELLRALRDLPRDLRLTVFVSAQAADDAFWARYADARVVLRAASPRAAGRWGLGEVGLLPVAAARAGVDVLHAVANFAPLGGPFARVLTLHDLIFRRLPSAVPPALRWGTELLVPLAARRAQRIITVSAASRDDIAEELRVAPEHIDVIPNGLSGRPCGAGDSAEARARLHLGDRPLALSVATAVAHKNLAMLLEALARITPAERPVLAFAGHGTDAGEIPARAATLGLTQDVRLLGAVPPDALEDLYAAAALLVTATRYEGFGLPVLEAMARGVAVVCSDLPVLHEVAGDTAIYVDQEDPPAIARALREVLRGGAEVEARRDRGRVRAARFTWDAAARSTLATYDRALSASGRRRSQSAPGTTLD
jgi:glycosyltransferase involved in cell wall biosynthesis